MCSSLQTKPITVITVPVLISCEQNNYKAIIKRNVVIENIIFWDVQHQPTTHKQIYKILQVKSAPLTWDKCNKIKTANCRVSLNILNPSHKKPVTLNIYIINWKLIILFRSITKEEQPLAKAVWTYLHIIMNHKNYHFYS